jgi:hypothetical protein
VSLASFLFPSFRSSMVANPSGDKNWSRLPVSFFLFFCLSSPSSPPLLRAAVCVWRESTCHTLCVLAATHSLPLFLHPHVWSGPHNHAHTHKALLSPSLIDKTKPILYTPNCIESLFKQRTPDCSAFLLLSLKAHNASRCPMLLFDVAVLFHFCLCGGDGANTPSPLPSSPPPCPGKEKKKER